MLRSDHRRCGRRASLTTETDRRPDLRPNVPRPYLGTDGDGEGIDEGETWVNFLPTKTRFVNITHVLLRYNRRSVLLPCHQLSPDLKPSVEPFPLFFNSTDKRAKGHKIQ